jgi:hypothetical protein
MKTSDNRNASSVYVDESDVEQPSDAEAKPTTAHVIAQVTTPPPALRGSLPPPTASRGVRFVERN